MSTIIWVVDCDLHGDAGVSETTFLENPKSPTKQPWYKKIITGAPCFEVSVV